MSIVNKTTRIKLIRSCPLCKRVTSFEPVACLYHCYSCKKFYKMVRKNDVSLLMPYYPTPDRDRRETLYHLTQVQEFLKSQLRGESHAVKVDRPSIELAMITIMHYQEELQGEDHSVRTPTECREDHSVEDATHGVADS